MDEKKILKINWDIVMQKYPWLKDYKNPGLHSELFRNMLLFSRQKEFLNVLRIKNLSEKDAKRIIIFL